MTTLSAKPSHVNPAADDSLSAQARPLDAEGALSGGPELPVREALLRARQTIVDLRTVLDPFDTGAKVVWATSAHALADIDDALRASMAPTHKEQKQ